MPKIKTNRGAAKRFDFTATGKVKRGHGYHSHILSSKTTKRKRKLRQTEYVEDADAKNVKKMVPYK
jgi:large subunit ribosomal protein L35